MNTNDLIFIFGLSIFAAGIIVGTVSNPFTGLIIVLIGYASMRYSVWDDKLRRRLQNAS